MKQVTDENDITSNVGAARKFTINANAELIDTLSNKLYKHPIRAIIRELVSNAIDANIAKGVQEPIKLHLPTRTEPEFYVEDFGIGMDEDTIYNVYTQYGNSTKNNSNDQIGGLGLGSKTPFAYTTQFMVESGTGKVRKTYTAFKDEDNYPQMTPPLAEIESDKTGTKVSFAVDVSDIDTFYRESVITLLFAQQMPEIVGGGLSTFLSNADCESVEEFNNLREIVKTDMVITNLKVCNIIKESSYSGTMFVEMGGVLYSVDMDQLLDGDCYGGVLRFYSNYDYRGSRYFILHLPIGSVNIQASREALNYSKHTKNVLNQAVISRIVDTVKNITEQITA